MQVSEEGAREFARAYKEVYVEELSLGEAQLMLGRLVTLYLRLARPLPSEKREEKRDEN